MLCVDYGVRVDYGVCVCVHATVFVLDVVPMTMFL